MKLLNCSYSPCMQAFLHFFLKISFFWGVGRVVGLSFRMSPIYNFEGCLVSNPEQLQQAGATNLIIHPLYLATHPPCIVTHHPLLSHPSPLLSHPSLVLSASPPLLSHPSLLRSHPSPLLSHPSPLTFPTMPLA